MKKTSKRIILSVLTLVLTVVALGTTTFAWFTLSSVASVSGLEGKVMAGDGLEVKLSSTNYTTGTFKNNLTVTDFESFLTAESFNKFSAVSTHLDAVKNELLPFTKLQLDETSGKMLLDRNATANTDYLEFTLEFRSLQSGDVKLTKYDFSGDDVTFDPTDGNSGFAYQQLSAAAAGTTSYKVLTSAKNATRISFSKYDKTNNKYVNVKSYQQGGTVVEGQSEIYTVNNSTIEGNSANNAPVNYGQWSYLVDGKGNNVFQTSSSNQKLMWLTNGLYDEYTLDTNGNVSNNGTMSSISMVSADTSVAEGGQNVVNLSKTNESDSYATGNIVVRVWIEGWDADTYDTVFDAVLKVALTFKKVSA